MKPIIEFLRRSKITYMVYNFFHRKQLVHNEIIYKKIGLRKKYYSPISSKDFEGVDETLFHFNKPVARLEDSSIFKNTSPENRESLLKFNDEGFAILKNYVSDKQVNRINDDIETGLTKGNIKIVNKNKIMFALHQYNSLAQVGNDKNLNELLGIYLQGNPTLFQSINFVNGSEQDTHSDSIHMTSFPLGGLLGVWVALEDVNLDNGPLHYYPGSHKLPYYLNKDYDNEGNKLMVGSKSYDEYEAFIEQKMKETNLPRVNFLAKKGDLLIWHANLFHGGNSHTNKSKTRKSVVFHYFKEGCVCYHEITQRPALFK
jgi:phytanoyl-CoA hydroxylase